VNPGDTAWVLASAALVMLMTPGLAFFYGGMVSSKSVLNMLMMNFITLGVVSVLWLLYGYSESFANDNFGNIIFSLEAVSVEQILAGHGSQIAESYRLGGAPNSWAADLSSAPQVLAAKGVQGFVLSSSYGLSGWVLAKEALVEPT